MSRRPLALLLVAPVLVGCGAAGSSTEDFTGEERRVARVIEDLSDAGPSRDGGGEICSRLLAPALVDRLKAGDRTCAAEVEDALADVTDYSLDVERVQISGATATARVKDGEDRVRDLSLTRQGRDWKISGF